MKKRRTWQSKLTKTELKHLKENLMPGVRITLINLRKLFKAQAEMRKKDPRPQCEPCWTCRKIAQKLGFEV